MRDIEKQAYIFGAMLTLTNRLQILGDKLDEKVSMKQWLLIAVILKCGIPAPTLSEVSQIIGCSRQNVKKMALILEKQGFVTLTKDDQDARIVRLHLTPKCAAYFEQRAEREDRFMASLFDSFDSDLTEGLYEGILHLVNNVERMEDEQNEKEGS